MEYNLSESEIRTCLAVFSELLKKPYGEVNTFLGSVTIDEMYRLENRLKRRYEGLKEEVNHKELAAAMGKVEAIFYDLGCSLEEMVEYTLRQAGESSRIPELLDYANKGVAESTFDRVGRTMQRVFEIVLEKDPLFLRDWLKAYPLGDLERYLDDHPEAIELAKTILRYAEDAGIEAEGADALKDFVERAEKRSLDTIKVASTISNSYWRYVPSSVKAVSSNDYYTIGHVVTVDDMLDLRGGVADAEYVCNLDCDKRGDVRPSFGIFFTNAGESVKVEILEAFYVPEDKRATVYPMQYGKRLKAFFVRKNGNMEIFAEILANRLGTLARSLVA